MMSGRAVTRALAVAALAGLQVGDHVPIELHLSDGTALRAQFAVRPAWGK